MTTKQQPKSNWYLKQLTIQEVKAQHIDAGWHWFDKNAMRGFNTHIETVPNMANIFITSEKHEDWHPRKYTLRWFNHDTKEIETLQGFMHYNTIEEARAGRKKWTEIILIRQLQKNLKGSAKV